MCSTSPFRFGRDVTSVTGWASLSVIALECHTFDFAQYRLFPTWEGLGQNQKLIEEQYYLQHQSLPLREGCHVSDRVG